MVKIMSIKNYNETQKEVVMEEQRNENHNMDKTKKISQVSHTYYKLH